MPILDQIDREGFLVLKSALPSNDIDFIKNSITKCFLKRLSTCDCLSELPYDLSSFDFPPSHYHLSLLIT